MDKRRKEWCISNGLFGGRLVLTTEQVTDLYYRIGQALQDNDLQTKGETQ